MPNIKIEGFDDINNLITELAANGEGLIKTALYPASHITYEEARQKIEAMKNISDADRNGLLTSLYHSKMYTENGVVYEVIGFTGYNERGVPNIVVARSIESGHSTRDGKSNVQKHPFMRPAANHTKAQVIQKMQTVISQEVQKIQKG